MKTNMLCRLLFPLYFLLGQPALADFHPLRLSLCEIEYFPEEEQLTIHLKLFLTDVNEAIVFDPNSDELAFCQPNELPAAEELLLDYLNEYFYVKVNDQLLNLSIESKKLSGEGDNTALGVLFACKVAPPLASMEVKNAVFTDLFFDQSNIVYVHVNGENKSLMLNKKTATHVLTF